MKEKEAKSLAEKLRGQTEHDLNRAIAEGVDAKRGYAALILRLRSFADGRGKFSADNSPNEGPTAAEPWLMSDGIACFGPEMLPCAANGLSAVALGEFVRSAAEM